MAVPCRVIEVTGTTAWVEHLGRRREVSLDLLDQPVGPGDHLLADLSTGYAVECCDPAPERRALALLKRVSDRAGGGNLGGLAA